MQHHEDTEGGKVDQWANIYICAVSHLMLNHKQAAVLQERGILFGVLPTPAWLMRGNYKAGPLALFASRRQSALNSTGSTNNPQNMFNWRLEPNWLAVQMKLIVRHAESDLPAANQTVTRHIWTIVLYAQCQANKCKQASKFLLVNAKQIAWPPRSS
jgi:hypothetical protein